MKKFINALLWILTTILIILGIVYIKSFFGIVCFITAILLAPIDEWQEKIHKFIKKPFLAIAISLLTALIVAFFIRRKQRKSPARGGANITNLFV